MPKKELSVCMAVYNEAKNMRRCLSAVVDWVDEVVIVDGKSTDETVKIAKSFGSKIKVYSFKNPTNFLKNRALAMKYANSRWLLVLDADEVVTKKLKQEILKTVASSKKEGYWLPRLNHFLGKPLTKGGQYPDYCLRLVLKKLAFQPTENLHNQVSIKSRKKVTGYLKNPLWHYPYPSFEVYLRKWVQYSSHEADLLIEKKMKPSFWLFVKYFVIKPKLWFLKTYFRHKGFYDGFAGFVFALFSSLRFLVIYIKLYEKNRS